MKKGFTLIEVLIAMVIIAIAFTAILKTTNESLDGTVHLESRQIANWVANEILTAAQIGSIKLGGSNQSDSSQLSGKTQMLHRVYHWQITRRNSSKPGIQLLQVTVSHNGQALYRLQGSIRLQQQQREITT